MKSKFPHRLICDHQLHDRKCVEDSNGGDVPEEQEGELGCGVEGPASNRQFVAALTKSRSGISSAGCACPCVPGRPHKGIAGEKSYSEPCTRAGRGEDRPEVGAQELGPAPTQPHLPAWGYHTLVRMTFLSESISVSVS